VTASRLCAVVSDIHFPHHHRAGWEAFLAWCRDNRPRRVVINGDGLDFEALSRFAKTPENVHAIDEIKVMVYEVNRLAAVCGEVFYQEGNHDERWSGIVAAVAIHLKGAIGLTLEEQCRFQGLDARVRWVREDVHNLGTQIGPFRIRHGHKQSKGFGPKHISATRLAKSMGHNEIVGHHHRAQLMCQTAFGKMAIAIANPSLTAPHAYAPGADWQSGFTVVECFGDDATAYPVVMTLDGRFAWGGRVYDGKPANDVQPSRTHGHAPEVDAGGLSFDDDETTATVRPAGEAPSIAEHARREGVDESTVRKWAQKHQRPWQDYRRAKGAA
jgi:predicted phosphodiesterase